MQRQHDGTHEGCFACKVQSIQIAPSAQPSRRSSAPPRTPNPAWERGIATDHRGMPYLDKNLEPMGLKEFAEKRPLIEERKRQAHQAPETLKD